jgi:hypothetical protein
VEELMVKTPLSSCFVGMSAEPRATPHSPQNFAPLAAAVPQLLQNMIFPFVKHWLTSTGATLLFQLIHETFFS